MSHHLDTPLAAQTGQLLIDDLYVFPGEGSTVFILDINSDVNGLHTEPGFHPEARYELKIHVNGGELEDLRLLGRGEVVIPEEVPWHRVTPPGRGSEWRAGRR